MNLHTYRVSIKQADELEPSFVHLMENTSVAFTTILSRTARFSANGSGRIEFLNQTFSAEEIQVLRNLYNFMENSVANCLTSVIQIRLEQQDSDTGEYIEIVPFTQLEGINLNFSNNVVDNNYVRMVVSCELIPAALRQEQNNIILNESND